MLFPSQVANESENRILGALNPKDYQQLFSQLERVTLVQGDVIYEADAPLKYVYFPETAVLSMLATMEDGRSVEVGPIGREGMVGLRIFLGAETTSDRVIVHVAGTSKRLKASVLKQLVANKNALTKKLMRYTQMLLAMTARSAACNQLHTLDQQFARWLLTMSDYVGGDDLRLTHDLIALTLGVRRAGVTEAANVLKHRGIIASRRNSIRMVDREGLRAAACECYQTIKDEYDELYEDLAKPD
jgi:CRP-like cAMP-binding protein